MRWDLWNPWARFYELHSTHPLVALRLRHLAQVARSLGQEPAIVFDEAQPEGYWDEFVADFLVRLLPWLAFGAFATAGYVTGTPWLYALALSAGGAASLVKLLYSYPQGFFPTLPVASLLKKVKVSGVRGVPCRLQGRIIGRGVPGLIWSEDFVLRDETGIIFLDYRQPSRLWEFFFGLMRGQQLQGVSIEATGWYRRAPVPYVELNTLTAYGQTRRCWVYFFKFFMALAMLLAGMLGIAWMG